MSIEAMKKAQRFLRNSRECDARNDALEAVEQAIAEAEKQEQGEPVAWYDREIDCAYTNAELDGCETNDLEPLYTTPQQRKPLTDEQIEPIAIDVLGYGALRKQDMELFTQSVRSIEAAHGIKE